MANRKKKHTLDNILPERKESYESFYGAISDCDFEDEEAKCGERKAYGCSEKENLENTDIVSGGIG